MTEPTPIFLINGILESGKTSFIKPLFDDDEFTKGNTTLLVVCEEGEIEYDENILKKRHTTMVTVEEEEDFSYDFLREQVKKTKATQIIIEWNGMWGLQELIQNMPEDFNLYQIITTVDSVTFENYAANMGQIMMEKLLNSDMIIFNRCTDEIKERLMKRNLKMINRQAQIYLDFEDGRSEPYDSGVPPFDMSKPILEIGDDDYGVWYIDIMDHADRYEGKTIRFKGMIAKEAKMPKGLFAIGRFAMVCCANDVQYMGLVCKGQAFNYLKNRDWVEITGKIKMEYNPLYDGRGPVFYPDTAQVCLPPKQEVVGF